ncbi:Mur ligase family protein [Butyrivibrio sp. VCB2006]|uniref:Mur ligase family protein n=1 Tax=Butyrivibrio sp. VCB2006 TaxID=1280679 RepID=UPI00041FE72C|nr:Mur ligase family protein [Butyrivibrio sp. VCB2006]
MDIFTILIKVIGIVAITVLGLRYYTHMLQLSSYQFQGYFRFLGSIQSKFGLHVGAAFSLVLAPLFLAWEQFGLYLLFDILAIVFIVMTVFLYLPKPAKKKFVVTPRVKRLFITDAVLICILLVISFILYNSSSKGIVAALIVWAVYIGLFPLLTALANLINKPIENRINQYYIDDAKRILREHPGLRIIGITGSFGKTSVKYYLTTLLSEGYRVLMTPESYNTPMGIVRTIREHLMPTHEIFVCEMGARHLHDIKEITDIVHPDDGILTSIGHQHLETFHSLENIISTKYELLDAVDEKAKEDGKADKHLKFVNGDNQIIRANMKYKDAIKYGMSEGCDYRATDIKVSGSGTSFTVTAPNGESCEFSTKLVGRHNVENIVGAIAAANSLGVPMTKLRIAVRRLAPVPHRLELVKHGTVSILDDAYNSNPNGAKVALETLGLFEDKVKILVTPGMVELGEKEDEYNKEFGRQAAEVCNYIILVGEKNSASIKAGAIEGGFDPERIFIKSTLNEATALMYELDAGREKVILLENDLPDNYK